MKRVGADSLGRTGFIEYNSYHHAMEAEAKAERIIGAINAKLSADPKGCIIM
jgi:hypothetical protein